MRTKKRTSHQRTNQSEHSDTPLRTVLEIFWIGRGVRAPHVTRHFRHTATWPPRNSSGKRNGKQQNKTRKGRNQGQHGLQLRRATPSPYLLVVSAREYFLVHHFPKRLLIKELSRYFNAAGQTRYILSGMSRTNVEKATVKASAHDRGMPCFPHDDIALHHGELQQ